MITCLSPQLKDVIIDALGLPEDDQLTREIRAMIDCSPGSALIFGDKCPPCAAAGKSKTKRAPSAYQQFMGTCMKENQTGDAKETMKSCVDRWNAQKGGK